jgi:hypothetical protein
MNNDFCRAGHRERKRARKTRFGTLFAVFVLIAVTLQSLYLPPLEASAASVALIGAGDIASCGYNSDEDTAKLLDRLAGTVFAVGDLAYTDGTYQQFVNCYRPTWGRHKNRTKPVPGNHEYRTNGAAGYFKYFNGTPEYYAYDLGDWRIYALNSEIDISGTSAQVQWLRKDLAKNRRLCVLAYWHRPRWSSGNHHGSNRKMEVPWKVLYNAGAELVINGHEHHYERFRQMNGAGLPVPQGLREIVVGTGGAALYGFGKILPTSEVRNSDTHGVLKLVLQTDRYSWKFIPVAGESFTDRGTTLCH